jgi:hypothetical protein
VRRTRTTRAAPSLSTSRSLDRLRDGAFKDRNEPALFEVTVPVDATRPLRSIVLLPGEATHDAPGQTRINIFAVTGIRIE